MTFARVWDDLRTPAEAAALNPGRPGDLDLRPDVLVVGGGVIGLATAVACRRAGLGRVVVIEAADRLALAASGSNGGAIAPDMHLLTDSPEFVAFGRASRDLYRSWDAALNLGLRPTRWLNIFPAGADPLVSRQAPGTPAAVAASSPFQHLTAAEVQDLEPYVRLPEGGTALLVDDQLGADPQRVVAVLASHAGQVATGVRMTGVCSHGDRVATVHTTAGDFQPGAIVLATGLVPPPWNSCVPQDWVKGHMIALAPGPWQLGSVLAGALGGGTPLPDGSIVCGGTFDEGDDSPVVRETVSDPLRAELARILPAAADAAISHRWTCLRPRIAGRQPVVDRLAGNLWFAGGHHTTGLMMAPATGAALASWIASGTPPSLVRTFTLPGAAVPRFENVSPPGGGRAAA